MGYRPRRALEPRSRSRIGVAFAVVMALIGAIMLAIGAPLGASASPGTGIWSDDARPQTTAVLTPPLLSSAPSS